MITQAAVKITFDNNESNKIIPLHRHGDITVILSAFGFKPNSGYKIISQGFIDEKGNFYDRKQAAEYIRQYHQETRLGNICEELYSEDLY